MPRKLRLGIGAKCSVITRYLHPAKTISDKYLNFGHRDQTSNLVCLRKEEKVVNRRTQTVAVFKHADFTDTEIHAVVRWVTVDEEGLATDVFITENPEGAIRPSERNEGHEATADEATIPDHVYNSTGSAEDIALIRALGFTVDDDNDPAPENDPNWEGVTTAPVGENASSPNAFPNALPNALPNASPNALPNASLNASTNVSTNVSPNASTNTLTYTSTNTLPNALPNASQNASTNTSTHASTNASTNASRSRTAPRWATDVDLDKTAEWGWSGVCPRKSANMHKTMPSLNGVNSIVMAGLSYAAMFMLFFQCSGWKMFSCKKQARILKVRQLPKANFCVGWAFGSSWQPVLVSPSSNISVQRRSTIRQVRLTG